MTRVQLKKSEEKERKLKEKEDKKKQRESKIKEKMLFKQKNRQKQKN